MDLLLEILIVGMAVGYITELVALILRPAWVKTGLTLPLAAAGHYLFSGLDWQLAISAPASGFFALVIISLISRPVVVGNQFRR